MAAINPPQSGDSARQLDGVSGCWSSRPVVINFAHQIIGFGAESHRTRGANLETAPGRAWLNRRGAFCESRRAFSDLSCQRSAGSGPSERRQRSRVNTFDTGAGLRSRRKPLPPAVLQGSLEPAGAARVSCFVEFGDRFQFLRSSQSSAIFPPCYGDAGSMISVDSGGRLTVAALAEPIPEAP